MNFSHVSQGGITLTEKMGCGKKIRQVVTCSCSGRQLPIYGESIWSSKGKTVNLCHDRRSITFVRFQYFAHLASVGHFRQVQTCSLPSLDHPPEPFWLDRDKDWDFQSSAFPCTYQEGQMQSMNIGGSSVLEEPTLSNYSCVPISQTRNEWMFHFPLFPPFPPPFLIFLLPLIMFHHFSILVSTIFVTPPHGPPLVGQL